MPRYRRSALAGLFLLLAGALMLLDRRYPDFLTPGTLILALGVALSYRGLARDRSTLFPGVFLVLAGLAWMLHRVGIIEVSGWQFWPLLVVILGISFVVLSAIDPDRRGTLAAGAILIATGLTFLYFRRFWDEIVFWGLRLWPLLLVGLGLYLIIKTVRRSRPRRP
ncbi:MAG: hypothetical protein C4524_06350 [Candidatus Zixiibacteriota bacterium]|nr:MAG: hypothetical protein C4524_06350 [candidate division Zixibacteria bacterium]